MPETTVNVYRLFEARKDNIWTAGQMADMQSIS